MRTSRRGEVDPFIVMDVMEAARREEATGRRVIHMEVGQPGTPAPEAMWWLWGAFAAFMVMRGAALVWRARGTAWMVTGE